MNSKQENQLQRTNGAIIFAEQIIKLITKIRKEQGNGYLHSGSILEMLQSRKTQLLQLKIKIFEDSKK